VVSVSYAPIAATVNNSAFCHRVFGYFLCFSQSSRTVKCSLVGEILRRVRPSAMSYREFNRLPDIMKSRIGVRYKNLTSKHEFCEDLLSDSHILHREAQMKHSLFSTFFIPFGYSSAHKMSTKNLSDFEISRKLVQRKSYFT
jgi:hypothetical protein